jgi:hypothetical protein
MDIQDFLYLSINDNKHKASYGHVISNTPQVFIIDNGIPYVLTTTTNPSYNRKFVADHMYVSNPSAY